MCPTRRVPHLLHGPPRCRIFVNLETTEKIYSKGREHLDPADGYVCFRNSELISGRLGKVTLGGGNKSGLFQARVLGGGIGPGGVGWGGAEARGS